MRVPAAFLTWKETVPALMVVFTLLANVALRAIVCADVEYTISAIAGTVTVVVLVVVAVHFA